MQAGKHRIGRAILRGRIHGFARWAHIYLSMVGFVIILLFSATGLTLNHPEWLKEDARTQIARGRLPAREAAQLGNGSLTTTAEWLQHNQHLRGHLHDSQCDADQCTLSYRAPGYSADIFVGAKTGSYTATIVSNGWLAALNDLHRGRDAGTGWSVALDSAAVLLILISCSGLLLVMFLHRRLAFALLLLLLGTLITLASLAAGIR